MVHDLELNAELLVLVLQGVEAVRTGRDDLLDLEFLERLDVLLGQTLEDELVAGATCRVAGAGFAVAEYAEADAGHVEQFSHCTGGLLRAVLVGACATDPEQPVDGLKVLNPICVFATNNLDFERQVLGPVHPGRGRHVPRVALVLEALEESVEFGGEVGLNQHLVAAHVHDVVDVFDVDGALLDTGTTRRTGPEDVLVDDEVGALGVVEPLAVLDLADDGLLLSGLTRASNCVGLFAQSHHQQLRREGLFGVPGGTLRLATAALGAGGEVEDALPREVADAAHAELRVLVEVVDVVERDRLATGGHRGHRTQCRAARRLTLEPDVEPGGETVPGHTHGEVGRDHHQPEHRRGDLDHRDEIDDVLEPGIRVGVQAADQAADREVRGVGVVDEFVLRGADEEDRGALDEDHGFDEVGLPHGGPEEAALPAETRRALDHPVDEQRNDRQSTEQTEDLTDPLVHDPVPDEGPHEVSLEELEERLGHRSGEHDERGVGEPVQDADPGPLQHARVEEGLLEHGQRAGRRAVGAVQRRLTDPHRGEHGPDGPGGQCDTDDRKGQRHHNGEDLHERTAPRRQRTLIGQAQGPSIFPSGGSVSCSGV